MNNRSGEYKKNLSGVTTYKSFTPTPLPPNPPIEMDVEILDLLVKANKQIALLDGLSTRVPNINLLISMYVRKEALLSSQIEGTQSTLNDLLRFEANEKPGVPVDDVAEVSSYVAAMQHGIKRVQDGFPLSLRLIREIHKILLNNSRGEHKTPGEFRRSQNWLGGTRPGNARFVPPPPDKVQDCLGELEKFMHKKDKIPILVKAALIHQQFETIHPFLDGNGRTGRLLVTLYLCVADILRSPLLYLSLFFKKHRELYYEKLSDPRNTGDWETWLNFFLEGVAETASDAKKTLISVKKLFGEDDVKISGLGRANVSAAAVFGVFKQKPLLSIAEITRLINVSKPTAISSVNRLVNLGIIKTASDKKWGQIYAYSEYIRLLSG